MQTAIILTSGLLATADAKTAHGLIRESRRFKILGVVDAPQAGKDAGEVLDGKARGIPVLASINDALGLRPQFCVIGVATNGGMFPPEMLQDVVTAITNGISIVNGLHDYLADRKDIAALAAAHNVELIDIRKPKPREQLHFWTGAILELTTPVIAVLGTDCALGKRTTQRILLQACAESGVQAQLVYTGQTGWLQGGEFGFIFDSTLNDFISGEIEHAIMSCAHETRADLILVEGQSALRNPTGPCGSEFLVSGNAKHVVLVHAPKREHFDFHPAYGKIPPLETEIQLIKLYGAEVIAIALNTEGCSQEEAEEFQEVYTNRFNIPVVLPLQDGCAALVPVLQQIISKS